MVTGARLPVECLVSRSRRVEVDNEIVAEPLKGQGPGADGVGDQNGLMASV
jgi:hypothetical protein